MGDPVGGDTGALRCPLRTAELLRSSWRRRGTCTASPGCGDVKLKPENLEWREPMRIALRWVPSVMKRLKKAREIIFT